MHGIFYLLCMSRKAGAVSENRKKQTWKNDLLQVFCTPSAEHNHCFLHWTVLNIMTVKVRKPQEFICFETFAIMLYRIRQNFCWLKFSPKAHTMYWDKNFTKFNFTNCASYLPGSCGWSSQVAMCNIYMYACMNVSKFSLCKKIHRKIFANGMYWRNW